jgi:hypothetical protein
MTERLRKNGRWKSFANFWQRITDFRPGSFDLRWPAERCISIFEHGGKFSLAPGFSPVMMVEKRREAVLTALVCREPVETGFILGTTGFT